MSKGARRADERWISTTISKTAPKSRGVPDLASMHQYRYPGDADGNGMYVLYANTEAELIEKIAAARIRREKADMGGDDDAV